MFLTYLDDHDGDGDSPDSHDHHDIMLMLMSVHSVCTLDTCGLGAGIQAEGLFNVYCTTCQTEP